MGWNRAIVPTSPPVYGWPVGAGQPGQTFLASKKRKLPKSLFCPVRGHYLVKGFAKFAIFQITGKYSGSLYLSGFSRGVPKRPSKKVGKKLENSKTFYEIVSTNGTNLEFWQLPTSHWPGKSGQNRPGWTHQIAQYQRTQRAVCNRCCV